MHAYCQVCKLLVIAYMHTTDMHILLASKYTTEALNLRAGVH